MHIEAAGTVEIIRKGILIFRTVPEVDEMDRVDSMDGMD
jgi:hypothetical protein